MPKCPACCRHDRIPNLLQSYHCRLHHTTPSSDSQLAEQTLVREVGWRSARWMSGAGDRCRRTAMVLRTAAGGHSRLLLLEVPPLGRWRREMKRQRGDRDRGTYEDPLRSEIRPHSGTSTARTGAFRRARSGASPARHVRSHRSYSVAFRTARKIRSGPRPNDCGKPKRAS
jgi:hypothetical protein